ncbi:hypothetical protein PACTADRAFT_51932 [Pachysolen tannophilus NRRL Y-2460]|uniref:Uncharacterized protein n=1 Tax=Pachysolen tannophilus NRRL Y-2460 TaxID=669874 RepID=A0A1E4TNJ2_PACTA|nr:hypothetical protein PACTADRAFT_51932 [Pachysolen tannophilus NRRL Y-2460]
MEMGMNKAIDVSNSLEEDVAKDELIVFDDKDPSLYKDLDNQDLDDDINTKVFFNNNSFQFVTITQETLNNVMNEELASIGTEEHIEGSTTFKVERDNEEEFQEASKFLSLVEVNGKETGDSSFTNFHRNNNKESLRKFSNLEESFNVKINSFGDLGDDKKFFSNNGVIMDNSNDDSNFITNNSSISNAHQNTFQSSSPSKRTPLGDITGDVMITKNVEKSDTSNNYEDISKGVVDSFVSTNDKLENKIFNTPDRPSLGRDHDDEQHHEQDHHEITTPTTGKGVMISRNADDSLKSPSKLSKNSASPFLNMFKRSADDFNSSTRPNRFLCDEANSGLENKPRFNFFNNFESMKLQLPESRLWSSKAESENKENIDNNEINSPAKANSATSSGYKFRTSFNDTFKRHFGGESRLGSFRSWKQSAASTDILTPNNNLQQKNEENYSFRSIFKEFENFKVKITGGSGTNTNNENVEPNSMGEGLQLSPEFKKRFKENFKEIKEKYNDNLRRKKLENGNNDEQEQAPHLRKSIENLKAKFENVRQEYHNRKNFRKDEQLLEAKNNEFVVSNKGHNNRNITEGKTIRELQPVVNQRIHVESRPSSKASEILRPSSKQQSNFSRPISRKISDFSTSPSREKSRPGSKSIHRSPSSQRIKVVDNKLKVEATRIDKLDDDEFLNKICQEENLMKEELIRRIKEGSLKARRKGRSINIQLVNSNFDPPKSRQQAY